MSNNSNSSANTQADDYNSAFLEAIGTPSSDEPQAAEFTAAIKEDNDQMAEDQTEVQDDQDQYDQDQDQEDQDQDDQDQYDQDQDQDDQDQDIADPNSEHKKQISRLEHQLRSEKGRTAAHQRKIAQLQAELKELEEPQYDPETAARLEALNAKRKELAEDYGEFAQVQVEHEMAKEQAEQTRRQARAEFLRQQTFEALVEAEIEENPYEYVQTRRELYHQFISENELYEDTAKRNAERIVEPQKAAQLLIKFRDYVQARENPAPSQSSRRKAQIQSAQSIPSSPSSPKHTGGREKGYDDYFLEALKS